MGGSYQYLCPKSAEEGEVAISYDITDRITVRFQHFSLYRGQGKSVENSNKTSFLKLI